MKLSVGYVQCEETAVDGSLDQSLIRVMDCSGGGSYYNGGGSAETIYTNGQTDIKYPVDPLPILPVPDPIPEDQPVESLSTPVIAPTDPLLESTTPGESSNNNLLLIAGGGLLLFFLLNKKKKRK